MGVGEKYFILIRGWEPTDSRRMSKEMHVVNWVEVRMALSQQVQRKEE